MDSALTYAVGTAVIVACVVATTKYLTQKASKPTSDHPLTVRQRDLIKTSWAAAEKLGAETVGVLLFKHIFEAAPGASGLFSSMKGFDPASDLSKNPALVKHAAGVVTTVGVAIGLLDDLEKLVPILKDLGGRHCVYNVKPEHYPIVGAAFLQTLQAGLGKAYTEEVAAAYTAMWGVVEATMLAGYPPKKPADAYPVKS